MARLVGALVVGALVLFAGCAVPPAGSPDGARGWSPVVAPGETGTATFTVSDACGIVPRGSPTGEPSPVAFDYGNVTLSPEPAVRYTLPAWVWERRQSSVRVSVPYRVPDDAVPGEYTHAILVLEGCSADTDERRLENLTITVFDGR